ncbi:hypothetical protein C8R43DRAFT_905642, partial [Mycena crocata]
FREIYSESLTSYRSSQTALQRAMTTQSKFGLASSNGAVPSVVQNHMKLPPHQLVQGAAGAEDKEEVATAKAAAVKEIAVVHATTTTYLLTLYRVQVEECRAHVSVTTCADAFATTLTEYGQRIITSAGDADLTQWEACIDLLKAAFTLGLQSLKFEFTARLDRDSASKEAKAAAVQTGNADAKMCDATKPIDQIMDEKLAKFKLALEGASDAATRPRSMIANL